MRVDQIEVGKTYERPEKREVVSIYRHIGGARDVAYHQDGNRFVTSWITEEDFAKWAVREVPHE